MFKRIASNFTISLEAVLANKLRSFLTALGIIFGVSAVIAMVAIGSGAQQEIMDQIKLVGVNNIVIKPVIEQEEEKLDETVSTESGKKNLSTGLTIYDANSIENIIPGIDRISPEIIIDTYVTRKAFRRSAKLVGVENTYFEVSGFDLQEGKFFNQDHLDYGRAVCVIGNSIKARFFSEEDQNNWLKRKAESSGLYSIWDSRR